MEIFGHHILQSWKIQKSYRMKFWSNFPIIINRMWFLNPVLLQTTQYIYTPSQVRRSGQWAAAQHPATPCPPNLQIIALQNGCLYICNFSRFWRKTLWFLISIIAYVLYIIQINQARLGKNNEIYYYSIRGIVLYFPHLQIDILTI